MYYRPVHPADFTDTCCEPCPSCCDCLVCYVTPPPVSPSHHHYHRRPRHHLTAAPTGPPLVPRESDIVGGSRQLVPVQTTRAPPIYHQPTHNAAVMAGQYMMGAAAPPIQTQALLPGQIAVPGYPVMQAAPVVLGQAGNPTMLPQPVITTQPMISAGYGGGVAPLSNYPYVHPAVGGGAMMMRGGASGAAGGTHVITQQPGQSRDPVHMICPFCRASIVTQTYREAGVLAWLMCIILVLTGGFLGCCLIPFFTTTCLDTTHACPVCRRVIARKNKV